MESDRTCLQNGQRVVSRFKYLQESETYGTGGQQRGSSALLSAHLELHERLDSAISKRFGDDIEAGFWSRCDRSAMICFWGGKLRGPVGRLHFR